LTFVSLNANKFLASNEALDIFKCIEGMTGKDTIDTNSVAW
jgi:hypothetical protein